MWLLQALVLPIPFSWSSYTENETLLHNGSHIHGLLWAIHISFPKVMLQSGVFLGDKIPTSYLGARLEQAHGYGILHGLVGQILLWQPSDLPDLFLRSALQGTLLMFTCLTIYRHSNVTWYDTLVKVLDHNVFSPNLLWQHRNTIIILFKQFIMRITIYITEFGLMQCNIYFATSRHV